jgi:hypothetical protein
VQRQPWQAVMHLRKCAQRDLLDALLPSACTAPEASARDHTCDNKHHASCQTVQLTSALAGRASVRVHAGRTSVRQVRSQQWVSGTVLTAQQDQNAEAHGCQERMVVSLTLRIGTDVWAC